MRITGTFLDEISHDIPHQNWGTKEWDQDFAHMKKMGIDTVILIRAGYRKFLTYPSQYLINKHYCFQPPVDLVQLFMELSEKHGMTFYFGIYDSGKYWDTGDMQHEIDVNLPCNRRSLWPIWQLSCLWWLVSEPRAEPQNKRGGRVDLPIG